MDLEYYGCTRGQAVGYHPSAPARGDKHAQDGGVQRYDPCVGLGRRNSHKEIGEPFADPNHPQNHGLERELDHDTANGRANHHLTRIGVKLKL